MGNNLFCAIDLQNDFISGSIGSEKAIELAKRVPSFLNIVEESENNYIIFTKDTHFADTYAETQEGKKLPVLHCVEDEDGWKIPDDIYFSNKEPGKCRGKVVKKNTFGSVEFAGIVEHMIEDSKFVFINEPLMSNNGTCNFVINEFINQTIKRVSSHSNVCR